MFKRRKQRRHSLRQPWELTRVEAMEVVLQITDALEATNMKEVIRLLGLTEAEVEAIETAEVMQVLAIRMTEVGKRAGIHE